MSRDEAPRPARPLVLPESFNGETDYCDWIDHFENVAAVNAWDDNAKLQWLKVRLTGRAQTALKRLPDATRRSYNETLAALKKRFEPESKRELYAAEFQTRRKGKTESWADFAEDLRRLADRAHADLEEAAREKLSLTRYLDQIADPQVSFGVKQSRPRNLDEAVAATLELESFKNIKPVVKVAQAQPNVQLEEPHADSSTRVIGAVGPPMNQKTRETSEELLQAVLARLDRLESSLPKPRESLSQRREQRSLQNAQQNRETGGTRCHSGSQPEKIICRKCRREGHYARGCATKTSQRQPQGN